jgi:predicted dehydrogenase
MHARSAVPAFSRRTLLAGASILPATILPGRGVLAGDSRSDRIRVGVIGCGGRGTGAAVQAALADDRVRVVAMADLFDDQLDSSADVLAAALGDRFDAPQSRRFVGRDAHRALLGCGVDLVILAATPQSRPAHLAAAVAAGMHVWCETPAAIDPAGLALVTAALAQAEAQGLVVASGLCGRFHGPTAETVSRIRAGAVGSIRSIVLHHDLPLPWWKPAGATPAETRERNWISHESLSGGHFVEHHAHALDRALWILGDDSPVSVEAIRPAAATGQNDGGVHVRYQFASGAVVDASCRRSMRPDASSTETVEGSLGRADLIRAAIHTSEGSWQAPGSPGGEGGAMYELAIAAMLRDVRSGAEPAGSAGRNLLRATALAIMGQLAARGGAMSREMVSAARWGA